MVFTSCSRVPYYESPMATSCCEAAVHFLPKAPIAPNEVLPSGRFISGLRCILQACRTKASTLGVVYSVYIHGNGKVNTKYVFPYTYTPILTCPILSCPILTIASIYLYVHLPTYLYVCIYLSIYLPIYLFICLSICESIFLTFLSIVRPFI